MLFVDLALRSSSRETEESYGKLFGRRHSKGFRFRV